MLASCRALLALDQVAEVRVLKLPSRGTYTVNASGWFNNFDAIAESVTAIEKRGPEGIYVTINPLHPGCLARTNNKLAEGRKEASSARDVIARNWMLVDIDPVRPSGVSSTREELSKARDLMLSVSILLEKHLGFPAGLKAHSGNGVHLLYRVALPNDAASQALIKECLRSLAEKMDNPHAIIDRTMHDATRIIKLWGTAARKGVHTEDRPHRISKLWTPLDFDKLKPVPLDALKALSRICPPPRPSRPRAHDRTAARAERTGEVHHLFDLETWMANYQIEVARVEPFDGTGQRYILHSCLFDNSHTGTSAVLGRAPSGAIFYKCQHASCSDKDWSDVRQLVEKRPMEHAVKPAGGADVEAVAGEDADDGSTPWDLAIQFVDLHYIDPDIQQITLRRHREQFYAYNGQRHIYQAISGDHINVQITRWLGELGIKNTARVVRDVYNSVSSMVTVSEEREMPFRTFIDSETRCARADLRSLNWMTLANGILDIGRIMNGDPPEACLMNHSTEWLSTIALPFPFPTSPAELACDRWLEFLSEVMEGDQERIDVIQEMFGYCFWDSTKLELFFILHGRGNNGKSTILEILQMLLHDDNVSSLSLEQISDPVLVGDLYMKLANICGDLPDSELIDEGVIKRISSGEPITCRRLYKGAMKFRPRCKMIFSTNPLPRIMDPTLGIWRRMTLIPFRHVVPNERIDIDLKTSLIAELPGILYWALQGAARLVRQKGRTASYECDQANRIHRMACFPVLIFMEECTQQSDHGSVRASMLWATYKRWCREFGLGKIKPLHTFLRDVVNFYPGLRQQSKRGSMAGESLILGIELIPGLQFGMDERTPPDRPMWSSE